MRVCVCVSLSPSSWLLGVQKAGEQPFPAVFLSFPSTKDSEWSARFPGKSTAHIISEAPLEWFEEWRGDGFRVRKRGEDYEALKAELTKRLLVRNPPALPTPCLRLRVATVWPDRSRG